MHLRSVELQVTDRAAAVEFLKEPWGLLDAGTRNGTTFLRATAARPYVIAITESRNQRAGVGNVFRRQAPKSTRSGSASASPACATAHGSKSSTSPAGAPVSRYRSRGRTVPFCRGAGRNRRAARRKNVPDLMLSHVVLNTREREAASRVLV